MGTGTTIKAAVVLDSYDRTQVWLYAGKGRTLCTYNFHLTGYWR